jgi:hypothetical protein
LPEQAKHGLSLPLESFATPRPLHCGHLTETISDLPGGASNLFIASSLDATGTTHIKNIQLRESILNEWLTRKNSD